MNLLGHFGCAGWIMRARNELEAKLKNLVHKKGGKSHSCSLNSFSFYYFLTTVTKIPW